MKVLIDEQELMRLHEIEQLLLERMHAESADTSAERVLLIAQMRIRMFAHVNKWIGRYRNKLSTGLFKHVQHAQHRPALEAVSRQAVS